MSTWRPGRCGSRTPRRDPGRCSCRRRPSRCWSVSRGQTATPHVIAGARGARAMSNLQAHWAVRSCLRPHAQFDSHSLGGRRGWLVESGGGQGTRPSSGDCCRVLRNDAWTKLDLAPQNGYHPRSGEGLSLTLVKTREVLGLTGLTIDQVRDWTVRRALVQPDIPAQKRGCEARFSWQTVLLLRLAAVLRTRFHVDLQAHRSLLTEVRARLDGATLSSLQGMILVIYDVSKCALVSSVSALNTEDDVILLRLNQHLEALSVRFGYREEIVQLPLFPSAQFPTSEVRQWDTNPEAKSCP